MKDDSGSCAVFTEHGSSASQMTAATVMDIFQGFQDVQDKQQIQYPLILRSQWKMRQRYSKKSKVRMQRYLGTYTEAPMAKIRVQYGRPSRSS